MKRLLVVASLVIAVMASAAAADTWPSRPITIIAPTTAGGPPDTIAPIIGERIHRQHRRPASRRNDRAAL
jgi:tripartite-type tricarboxylate transporter receptor subunit TctC